MANCFVASPTLLLKKPALIIISRLYFSYYYYSKTATIRKKKLWLDFLSFNYFSLKPFESKTDRMVETVFSSPVCASSMTVID